jgi:hypothetical protein
MPNDNDDIFIKNPNREAAKVVAPYEPEHVRLNRKPIPASPGGRLPPEQSVIINSADEVFASIDGAVLDLDGHNIEDYNNHTIDNNEFIVPLNILEVKKTNKVVEEKNETGIPQVGDYILMVFGKIILTGNFDDVEEKVKSIVYGEDTTFTKEVKTEDIVVLKRLAIKVGVFINE